MSTPLLLMDRKRWIESAAIPSITAQLHRRDSRRMPVIRRSHVLQIDRVKEKHRELWGLKALFLCACDSYAEIYGELSPNDPRRDIQ